MSEASIINMRDYQVKAHDAVWAEYDAGVTRQLVSIATGGGKTYLASHVIRTARARGFERVLFLVHRDELVSQSIDSLEQISPNMSIGVVKAERNDLHADIIVASAQTLAQSRRLAELQDSMSGRLLFVSDECHHDMSPSRRRAIETLVPELLVGLTATPNRGDKVGLDAIYQKIVFHLPMLELIAMGKLTRLRGLRIDTEEDLDSVHTVGNDLNQGELADSIDNDSRNDLIVASYVKHASDRRKTVAFCVTVAHAEHLRDRFRAAGIVAEMVEGETPTEDRRRILGDFKAGRIPVLVNVMVLSEGYDEPGIDCILWTRPTKSQALYVQCIGRGARVAPNQGKESCLVIDFVDSSSRHKLITLPSLAGEESESKAGVKGPGRGEFFDLLDFAQQNTKLRERAAVAVNLFAGSDYIWKTVGGFHMAPAGKGLFLMLKPDGEEFIPCSMETAGAGHLEPLFDRALDMETAMSVAESRMEASPLTLKNARWRTKPLPPSEAQITFAQRLRLVIPAGATRDQVSALIDEKTFERAVRNALREAR